MPVLRIVQRSHRGNRPNTPKLSQPHPWNEKSVCADKISGVDLDPNLDPNPNLECALGLQNVSFRACQLCMLTEILSAAEIFQPSMFVCLFFASDFSPFCLPRAFYAHLYKVCVLGVHMDVLGVHMLMVSVASCFTLFSNIVFGGKLVFIVCVSLLLLFIMFIVCVRVFTCILYVCMCVYMYSVCSWRVAVITCVRDRDCLCDECFMMMSLCVSVLVVSVCARVCVCYVHVYDV